MPWYDLPLERLREYRTQTAEPPGLDEWWAKRLDDARAMARPLELQPYQADLYRPLEVYDAEFSGAGGDRIRAWYIKPTASASPPVVVRFIGYGGGRSLPSDHTLLPALGYAILVMDSRGQGGRWSSGATGDGAAGPENSQVMSRGISTPESYYFTRLFTDAALAVDAALELSGGRKVAVSGGSQGGGLALAAAALQHDEVAVCHADVPFLCDIQRAITLAPHDPYTEIPEFLSQNVALIPQALETLRYVDCALLARRITAQCLLSVGLMDD
ncbi:MAG TPA: alpha/beta fold hydrolase, partial [Trebonia sp.]